MADDPECQYSKAFENHVQRDDDLVGLLAYALFKQSVREAAQQAQQSAFSRNPPSSVVNTYRHSAERMLETFAASVVEDSKADILQSAAVESIRTSTNDIKNHVTQRTGFGAALLTNMVAWILTLAVTVFIIWLAGRGGPEEALVEVGRKAENAQAAIQGATATPPVQSPSSGPVKP